MHHLQNTISRCFENLLLLSCTTWFRIVLPHVAHSTEFFVEFTETIIAITSDDISKHRLCFSYVGRPKYRSAIDIAGTNLLGYTIGCAKTEPSCTRRLVASASATSKRNRQRSAFVKNRRQIFIICGRNEDTEVFGGEMPDYKTRPVVTCVGVCLRRGVRS